MKLPKIISANITATIFGTKLKVCSCICVVAWNTLMTNPTTKAMISTGPDTIIIVKNAFLIMSNTIISVTKIHLYLKLSSKDSMTKYQPSTKTNNKILKGNEIITGGSMNIPMDINILATTISITKKGM